MAYPPRLVRHRSGVDLNDSPLSYACPHRFLLRPRALHAALNDEGEEMTVLTVAGWLVAPAEAQQ